MMFNIASTIGENCITVEDGERIYTMIFPLLSKGQEVTLDFSGVAIFASPFFNAGIGQLLRDLPAEQLSSHLHFQGLSAHGNHVLTRVIENAKRYYTNPHFRDSVEKVLAQQAHDL
ncbi:MAG: STAS-like domain-containing protein [Methanoregula sp.]|jgi:hypothetical protein